MFKILNIDKLNEIKDENELSSRFSKKTIEAIELILNFEKDFSIRPDNKILEYQNTNIENFQWLLKDFIEEINSTTKLILDCLFEIFENAEDIILENPTILNHSISLGNDMKTIESETIKEYYVNYLNLVNTLGFKVSKFLKLYDFSLYQEFNRKMLFEPGFHCMINENKELIKYTKENLFNYNSVQEKRSSIVIDCGRKIYNLLQKHKNVIDSELAEALEFFSCSDGKKREFYFNTPIYSNNLSDEKLIPKRSHVHFYKYKEFEFDIVSLDTIKISHKSRSFGFSFRCSFGIDYYIKKYLIELYTKKDMFSFMCLYKDFLSMYDYINFRKKSDFNQKHPMIIEANVASEIQDLEIKFDKRLRVYIEKLNDIKKINNETLFFTKTIKEWCDSLDFPESTKKYFYSKFNTNKEPTYDEFRFELFNYADNIKKSEINKILNNDSKKEIFLNIEKTKNFFKEVIENILTRIYNSELIHEETINYDFSRFLKRETATFHTTLKDSIVIDYRDKENIIISDNIEKLLDKETIEKINEILFNHKYHDYIEIDKDIFGKESALTIGNILDLIEKTNDFDFPVKIRTALKFRKLKNYKANGIYFSFSKQLGLDFRDGFGAYMHEMAHHIDLNTENYNRTRIINYLYNYFKSRVTQRVDYYLKSEELIARAAEISLILLLGRYEKFKLLYDKNEINESTLINAVNETFLKTSYCKFMGSLSSYKDKQYFDYETAILNKDFKSIDYLLVYFKSFWSGKILNIKDELRLPSNLNITYSNDKKFAKNNELSYDYFYRNIFIDMIHF